FICTVEAFHLAALPLVANAEGHNLLTDARVHVREESVLAPDVRHAVGLAFYGVVLLRGTDDDAVDIEQAGEKFFGEYAHLGILHALDDRWMVNELVEDLLA